VQAGGVIVEEQAFAAVAIVDYGMGNLFSVKHACERVGINASITSSKAEIERAKAIILPGVGAFGDAMAVLARLDLVGLLCDSAASGKPFIGICLGMHLLMSEGYEFGHHRGLNIIEGSVVRLEEPVGMDGRVLKVPEVQWNRVERPKSESGGRPWEGTMLNGIHDSEYMYFVHSYYAKPKHERHVLSWTTYGNIHYCSSVSAANVFACQFHPERSGGRGLVIYRNLASLLSSSVQ
jgi:imidazole glycerol-phosphate synthase subunit HisH